MSTNPHAGPEVAAIGRVLDEIKVLLRCSASTCCGRPTPRRRSDGEASAATAAHAVGLTSPTTPVFTTEIKQIRPQAIERAGEFVALTRPRALRRETLCIPQSVVDRRKALIDAGALTPNADIELYRFVEDASFSSPLGASPMITGRSNGQQTWRVAGHSASHAAPQEKLMDAAGGKS